MNMGGDTEAVDEVSLGKRLQQARQSAGLTQQQLAQATDLSYSTLAKIERGAIKTPSVFTIQRIAQVTKVSLDELMGLPHAAKPLQQKSTLKFIYFDINGCLVRFFHKAFSVLAEETGVPNDRIETLFWHYNDAVCRGEMKLSDFNDILAKTLGVSSVDWTDYYLGAIEPIDGMKELLEWTAERYQIGLLSNIMPGFIQIMIDKGVIPHLDYAAVVDSSEVGAIKPESKIYEIAQGLTGVLPEEILFIDDSRANLMAAEKCGWKVMWFDDYYPEESIKRIKNALG
jgi:FMN phosphatase YigB (HAD superfamily)